MEQRKAGEIIGCLLMGQTIKATDGRVWILAGVSTHGCAEVERYFIVALLPNADGLHETEYFDEYDTCKGFV